MKTTRHLLSYLAHFFVEWEMFRTKVVEKIKTHILRPVYIFFFENRAIYEIKWKHTAEGAGRKWQYGTCALHAG